MPDSSKLTVDFAADSEKATRSSRVGIGGRKAVRIGNCFS